MAIIYPVEEVIIRTNNLPTDDLEETTSSTAIGIEKLEHQIKAEQRIQRFNDILSNTPSPNGWTKYVVYGFSSLVITLLTTSQFTLIPAHNVIHYPSYWYEFPLQSLVFGFSIAAVTLIQCSYWLNIRYIKNIRTYLKMCLAGMVVLAIVSSSGYIIWTYVLQYRYPIPFVGYMFGYCNIITFYVTLWFQFPANWRRNTGFLKRLKYFFIAITFNQTMMIQYSIIGKVLLTFKENGQWFIAIFLPFTREINIWITKKLATKAANGDIAAVNITTEFNVNTRHALFLSYILGSLSTTLSSAIILGLDFFYNVLIALRIVWLRKRKPEDNGKVITLLQELMIAEMVEFIVPLVYTLCFFTAYYGPNAKLIGNIKNDYWQYVAVEDANHTMKNVSMFFFVDLLSGVTCFIILWLFCRINFIRVYIALQKEFGLLFLLTFVYILTLVRNN